MEPEGTMLCSSQRPTKSRALCIISQQDVLICGEELLASLPKAELAVRDCLFNKFTAILHI